MFHGQSIRLQRLDDGFVELCFDREGDVINKLDARTVDEFRQATAAIAADPIAAEPMAGIAMPTWLAAESTTPTPDRCRRAITAPSGTATSTASAIAVPTSHRVTAKRSTSCGAISARET